ncbi:MAG: hypothetical protein ACI3W8_00465 [Oscillospiraceae bacterium]
MEKCCNKIWKLLAALVALTAAVFVIVKFWDKILEGLGRLKERAEELRWRADESEDFLN